MFSKIVAILVCISFSSYISANFVSKPDYSSSTCGLFKYVRNNTFSPTALNTKLSKFTFTFKPLVIQNAVLTPLVVINTGHALEVYGNYLAPDGLAMHGGMLCNKYYIFHRVQCIQNTNLSRSYHTIDGKSTPFTARIIYFDPVFGTFDKALNNCGGVVVIDFPIEFSPLDNPLFYPVQVALLLLRKAGRFISLPAAPIYAWFDRVPLLHEYYAIWGSYQDLEKGKDHPCVINLITTRSIYPLSKRQFLFSLGGLKDVNGKTLSNSQPLHKLDGRIIFKASGLRQALVPF